MALRTIRVEGDPVLGKVCREVTEVTPKIVTLLLLSSIILMLSKQPIIL